jgi:cupin fold WbuC family metalloprotein
MIKITDNLLNDISNQAKISERKRCNYNFHKSHEDLIQRFINALEPGTYIRPHKHENPDKAEMLIILKGRVLIIEFNENGEVSDYFVLDFEKGNKGAEISPKVWHTFIALQEGSAVYELKEGPFIGTDKIFAEWSPEEGTSEAHDFNTRILRTLEKDVGSKTTNKNGKCFKQTKPVC